MPKFRHEGIPASPASRYTRNMRGEGMPNFIYVIHGGQAAGGMVTSSREIYAAELD